MSPLENIGMTPLHTALWALAMLGLSLLAFALVWRREADRAARIIWLILLILFPIICPLAVFLYYLLLRPLRRKKRKKTK